MEKSSFFNSVSGDRVYRAEEWAEYFASFIGNGVFPVPSTSLQVVAGSGMAVAVKTGKAWINGYFYYNTSDLPVTLATADGVLNRIDRIVVRWDLTERKISVAVKSSGACNFPCRPCFAEGRGRIRIVSCRCACRRRRYGHFTGEHNGSPP